MRAVMNSLPLQALLVLWIICSANGAPYSKYGRTCKDIGCLPREVCVMSYESCSFNQQENVSCGRYPTCKKNQDAQNTQQNSGPSIAPTSPTPNTNIWNFPATVKVTTERTTTTTKRAWTTKAPFYNPANPSYNGGGSYYGNRYGDDTTFGGSSFTRPTTRYTTRSPSSFGGSSSSFNGFLSGLSNVLSGDVGKFIGSALSNRGGSSGGSFGSLFGSDTRPITENRRGGLFSENTGSTNNQNAYPVSRYGDANKYPVTRYGDASPSVPNPTPSHGSYGWKLS